MGKRVNIKYFGKCMMTKIVRRGKIPYITLKCPGASKKKIKTAQWLIDESNFINLSKEQKKLLKNGRYGYA